MGNRAPHLHPGPMPASFLSPAAVRIARTVASTIVSSGFELIARKKTSWYSLVDSIREVSKSVCLSAKCKKHRHARFTPFPRRSWLSRTWRFGIGTTVKRARDLVLLAWYSDCFAPARPGHVGGPALRRRCWQPHAGRPWGARWQSSTARARIGEVRGTPTTLWRLTGSSTGQPRHGSSVGRRSLRRSASPHG